MFANGLLMEVAPIGPPTADDQRHLALYAALIDADAAGADWHKIATEVMSIDPSQDGAERCWKSHLERATWIASDGLKPAMQAFSTSFS